MDSIGPASLGREPLEETHATSRILTKSRSQYTPQSVVLPKSKQTSPVRSKSHEYVKHNLLGSQSDYRSDLPQSTVAAQDTQPLPTTRIGSLWTDFSTIEDDENSSNFERAQAIFRKYNLEIDEADWNKYPRAQVERVHKPARMRVRWTCHECKTSFGHDKICVECAHLRCRKCTRYPARRKKPRKDGSEHPPKTQEYEVSNAACHECQTIFEIGSLECATCHHTICDRCLQEIVHQAEQASATSTYISSTHTATDEQ